MRATSIRVTGVSKKYREYDPNRAYTFQEAAIRRFGRRHKTGSDHFWALKDINFEVYAGSTVGLLGQNGAGKSTLLRLLGGIGRPDQGKIEVDGKVSGLLDLGAGFHSDLTGRENIYITGVVGGLTRQEVAQQFDSIVSFAELEPFIDHPLRTYSSGMYMRLAFSVAVHVRPDVLLIDEVLAVGDVGFQKKCIDRIGQFRKDGCAIVLVTHDATLVSDFCDQALWLDYGQPMGLGAAREVSARYSSFMETRHRTPKNGPAQVSSNGIELRFHENRFGSQEVVLSSVRTRQSPGSGNSVNVQICYRADTAVADPIFGVTILDKSGRKHYEVTSFESRLALPLVEGEGMLELDVHRLTLADGEYFIDVGVYERDWAYTYDYHHQVYPLVIVESTLPHGDRSNSATRAVWVVRQPV